METIEDLLQKFSPQNSLERETCIMKIVKVGYKIELLKDINDRNLYIKKGTKGKVTKIFVGKDTYIIILWNNIEEVWHDILYPLNDLIIL